MVKMCKMRQMVNITKDIQDFLNDSEGKWPRGNSKDVLELLNLSKDEYDDEIISHFIRLFESVDMTISDINQQVSLDFYDNIIFYNMKITPTDCSDKKDDYGVVDLNQEFKICKIYEFDETDVQLTMRTKLKYIVDRREDLYDEQQSQIVFGKYLNLKSARDTCSRKSIYGYLKFKTCREEYRLYFWLLEAFPDPEHWVNKILATS